jgi:ABC-type nitrate/sulfonate/bicarbonate transport system ATPase subunit
MPAESPLSLEDVGFTYPNGTEAIGSISLTVAAGEVAGIVGPSGCGKSTLLHLLAGLRRPTRGTLTRDISVTDRRHPLAMVFQRDTLLPWLTAKENVMFFTRFRERGARRPGRRSPKVDPEVSERADRLLAMVGLSDHADAYPYQLSGGMNRRVAFLSAVAPLPHILLLDEPFSSVDEPTRIEIHQDVLNVIREFGMTAILVTHDLAEAITLTDRVLILTKRPATVATQHTIPFGRERNMLELRQTSDYLELYGRLWSELGAQIRSGRSEGRHGGL